MTTTPKSLSDEVLKNAYDLLYKEACYLRGALEEAIADRQRLIKQYEEMRHENYPIPDPNINWTVNYSYVPVVVTLRQWFDLLAGIFGERRCTPFDQMELLLCLKEQGFEL